jgi:hypothetical protein
VAHGQAHRHSAPAERFPPWDGTTIIRLDPNPPQCLQGGEIPKAERCVGGLHPRQELIAVHADLPGECLALARVLQQVGLIRPEAIAGIPVQRHVLLRPSGLRRTELIERIMHGLQDALQAVQGADRRQNVGRIGPLRATCLDPPPCFAGGQEGIEEPLAGRMGKQATAKIVQQREVEARVVQVKAEGVFPVHTAADRIGCLAISESFDVSHHQRERQAPGRDFHRTPGGRIQIRKELIVIEGAVLGAQRNLEVPFGERRLHGGRCGLWGGR